MTTTPAPTIEEDHVYAVEWTARERTFWIDGREQPRSHVRVPRPRRQPVRSALTADYATVDAVEAAGPADDTTGGRAVTVGRSIPG